MLLSNLGVADDVFLHLLKTSLAHLSEMFIDESVAREKIKSIPSINWRKLEEAGFHITSEPYLRSLMKAFYRYGLIREVVIRTASAESPNQLSFSRLTRSLAGRAHC